MDKFIKLWESAKDFLCIKYIKDLKKLIRCDLRDKVLSPVMKCFCDAQIQVPALKLNRHTNKLT